MVFRKRTGADPAAGGRIDDSPASFAEQDSQVAAADDGAGRAVAADGRLSGADAAEAPLAPLPPETAPETERGGAVVPGPAAPVPAEQPFEAQPARSGYEPSSMIPVRANRPAIESFFVRLIATGGIIGIGTAIAAIMASQHSHGWLIGVVVSVVSVLLAAVLWSSRRL